MPSNCKTASLPTFTYPYSFTVNGHPPSSRIRYPESRRSICEIFEFPFNTAPPFPPFASFPPSSSLGGNPKWHPGFRRDQQTSFLPSIHPLCLVLPLMPFLSSYFTTMFSPFSLSCVCYIHTYIQVYWRGTIRISRLACRRVQRIRSINRGAKELIQRYMHNIHKNFLWATSRR